MTLNKNVFGLIHDYYPRDRLISLEIKGKIHYFHYPKNLKRYLEIVMAHKHAYIDFLVEDEIKIIRGCITYKIKDAFEIFYESNHERVVVYTGSALKEEIRDIINSLEDKSVPSVMKHFKMNYAGSVDMSLVNSVLRSL